jgi:uncharacterized protein DUF4384
VVTALFLLLASQVPSSPVRLWLGSGPTIVSGDQSRVYVQTSTDGHLVVLHARPDGRVEVLFPEDPASDPFVRAGTYEIRTPVSAGPDGRGMVVAALSPDRMWFDEFVHNGNWDAAALTGAGAGGDPEALLTDVVQRMLGDGSFNYDVVTYIVAPRPAVIADAAGHTLQPADVCIECSFTQVDLVVSGNLPFRPVSHRRRRAPAAPAVRAIPLIVRARPAAARATAATRSLMLVRVVHAERSSGLALAPVNEPAISRSVAVPARGVASPVSTPASGGLVGVPATVASPIGAPETRGVARPHVGAGAAQAGPGAAAPAPARAGSSTGVGLGAVHTAGWRH